MGAGPGLWAVVAPAQTDRRVPSSEPLKSCSFVNLRPHRAARAGKGLETLPGKELLPKMQMFPVTSQLCCPGSPRRVPDSPDKVWTPLCRRGCDHSTWRVGGRKPIGNEYVGSRAPTWMASGFRVSRSLRKSELYSNYLAISQLFWERIFGNCHQSLNIIFKCPQL